VANPLEHFSCGMAAQIAAMQAKFFRAFLDIAEFDALEFVRLPALVAFARSLALDSRRRGIEMYLWRCDPET